MRLRFYSLAAIFFLVPLLYSGTYLPGVTTYFSSFFGIPWLGFETFKVFLFFILLSGALLGQLIIVLPKKIFPTRAVSLGVLGFFWWTLLSFFINYLSNPFFVFGNPEKHHGWFFYVALGVLFLILQKTSPREQKIYWKITVTSFFLVLLYGIFQKLGLDPLQKNYTAPIDLGRLYSTLGNPNYLAGYILLFMPFFDFYTRTRCFVRSLMTIVLGIFLFLTGSHTAWGIFLVYYAFQIFFSFFPWFQKKYFIFSVLFLGALVLWAVSFYYWDELMRLGKFRSFISRFYLWMTWWKALTHHISTLFFGFGPDGFLAVSDHFRHEKLFSSVSIDRSHNIFIDLMLHFWFPLSSFLLYTMVKKYRDFSPPQKMSFSLFFIFFSFNIPVLVHFIFLVQILTFSPSSFSLQWVHDQKE